MVASAQPGPGLSELLWSLYHGERAFQIKTPPDREQSKLESNYPAKLHSLNALSTRGLLPQNPPAELPLQLLELAFCLTLPRFSFIHPRFGLSIFFIFPYLLHSLVHDCSEAMESKARESDSDCIEVPLDPIEDIFDAENADNTNRDQQEMSYFGKTQQLKVGCLRPF